MNQVVCAIEPSMHSAYQSCETIEVSATALYDKLSVLEPTVSGLHRRRICVTKQLLMIALPPERWAPARTMPRLEAVGWLRKMAQRADLDRYQKHPRQPKQPSPSPDSSSETTHVSTAQLLAQQGHAS